MTGMDLYMASNFGAIGDSATIRIRSDSHIGPLTEFVETVSIIDTDGTASIDSLHRVHVDFTSPVSLVGGVEYWVGMSGLFPPSVLVQAGIRDGIGPLLDNQTARYSGITFDAFATDVGDTPFRLWGAPIPIPGTLWLFASGLLGMIGIAKRKVS